MHEQAGYEKVNASNPLDYQSIGGFSELITFWSEWIIHVVSLLMNYMSTTPYQMERVIKHPSALYGN